MAQTTLYEVADRAGVSLATASRVLNGSVRKVGEPFRARVLAAAAELNYSPNGPAQAMARGHSNTVGLIVADLTDPYFTQIAAGVVDAAEDRQLRVTMGISGPDRSREAAHVAGFRSGRTRGVIIVGSRDASGLSAELATQIESYRRAGGRVVMVSQRVGDLPSVELDNRGLSAELGRRLVALGHQRFIVLAGPAELSTAVDRTQGVRAGLRASGVAAADIELRHGTFDRAGGLAEMTELLAASPKQRRCVICVNDVMALGAIAAIRQAGLTPGIDVPVAGFDGIAHLDDVYPSLTTVAVPLRELGRQAIEVLAEESDEHRLISGEIVLGGSTALP